jgi:catechol 2,3-dioxygenase-like lactoylglutathione lyase family enzyme
MLTRVHHVGIATTDLEAGLRFYRDMLGLPAAEAGDGALGGVEIPVGRSAIRIAKAAEGAPEGIDYLCFETDEPGAQTRWLDADAHLGLRLAVVPADGQPEAADHNVTCIDHLVITSADSARCAAHFRDALGIEIKRTMTRPGTGAHLEFAKLVDVILEFGGPPEPKPGPLNARVWGMVFAVRDLDGTVERLRANGYPVTDPRPAVQPGAKISMVKEGTAGVPFALIQYGAG